jgi:hypothetical protein
VLANILGLGPWNKEGRKDVSKDFASSISIFTVIVIWVFNYFDGFLMIEGQHLWMSGQDSTLTNNFTFSISNSLPDTY